MPRGPTSPPAEQPWDSHYAPETRLGTAAESEASMQGGSRVQSGESHSTYDSDGLSRASIPDLLSGLREAVALLYNVTGKASCFSLEATGPAAGNVGPWGKSIGYLDNASRNRSSGYYVIPPRPHPHTHLGPRLSVLHRAGWPGAALLPNERDHRHVLGPGTNLLESIFLSL